MFKLMISFIVLFWISCHNSCFADVIKPNYIPYCTTRDKCKPVCSCEVAENCTVLEMDDTMRKSIIFFHNQIRDIQSAGEPIPQGMTMIEYDDQLEEISKCWAARCENEYSECFTTPNFMETSQSVLQIALEEGQKPEITLWMQMMNFMLGQKTMSAETINDLPFSGEDETLNNFAQLLSDQIKSTGCAWSLRDDNLTFVCTYGPRGPAAGEPIYKIGPRCSACPHGYECDGTMPFARLCKRNLVTTTTIGTPPPPPEVPAQSPASPPPVPPPKPPETTPKPPISPPPQPPPTQDFSPPPSPTTTTTTTTPKPSSTMIEPPSLPSTPSISIQTTLPPIPSAPTTRFQCVTEKPRPCRPTAPLTPCRPALPETSSCAPLCAQEYKNDRKQQQKIPYTNTLPLVDHRSTSIFPIPQPPPLPRSQYENMKMKTAPTPRSRSFQRMRSSQKYQTKQSVSELSPRASPLRREIPFRIK